MKQEVFVRSYKAIKPIVMKAYNEYYIQLWDLADMEQEAMIMLYKLLKTFPELEEDEVKLRRYFKTKFRNRLNDEVRRQDTLKRQVNKVRYVEISDVAYCIPSLELDPLDRLIYDEQVKSFRDHLSPEKRELFERLLAGEVFKGRKNLIRELRLWMIQFDPYSEDDDLK